MQFIFIILYICKLYSCFVFVKAVCKQSKQSKIQIKLLLLLLLLLFLVVVVLVVVAVVNIYSFSGFYPS